MPLLCCDGQFDMAQMGLSEMASSCQWPRRPATGTYEVT
jgi:hypothetical protein